MKLVGMLLLLLFYGSANAYGPRFLWQGFLTQVLIPEHEGLLLSSFSANNKNKQFVTFLRGRRGLTAFGTSGYYSLFALLCRFFGSISVVELPEACESHKVVSLRKPYMIRECQ